MKFTPDELEALDFAAKAKAKQLLQEGRTEVDTRDRDTGVQLLMDALHVNRKRARAMMDYLIEKANDLVRAAQQEN